MSEREVRVVWTDPENGSKYALPVNSRTMKHDGVLEIDVALPSEDYRPAMRGTGVPVLRYKISSQRPLVAAKLEEIRAQLQHDARWPVRAVNVTDERYFPWPWVGIGLDSDSMLQVADAIAALGVIP